MIVFPDQSIEGTVGGGALEKRVIDEAITSIKSNQNKLIQIDLRENSEHSVGGICGGDLKVFVEVLGQTPRLLIFGAGHVGQTLAEMAHPLELDIEIYDDRDEFTRPERYPKGVKPFCVPFEEAITKANPKPCDFIVIMTYKFTHDSQLLYDALQTQAHYIGMIGSDIKCMRVINDLKKKGVTQEKLDFVHAPIGLDIGAHTPAEVAVSTLAEIIKVSNVDAKIN